MVAGFGGVEVNVIAWLFRLTVMLPESPLTREFEVSLTVSDHVPTVPNVALNGWVPKSPPTKV
jgi:hypothetical protein